MKNRNFKKMLQELCKNFYTSVTKSLQDSYYKKTSYKVTFLCYNPVWYKSYRWIKNNTDIKKTIRQMPTNLDEVADKKISSWSRLFGSKEKSDPISRFAS